MDKVKMSNEEAIEIIRIAKAEVEWEYPMDYQIAFDKAIDALEKLTPRKPNWQGDELCMDPYCPNCGEWLDDNEPFCSECNQMLDWHN